MAQVSYMRGEAGSASSALAPEMDEGVWTEELEEAVSAGRWSDWEEALQERASASAESESASSSPEAW